MLSLHLPCSMRLVRLTDARPQYANSYSFVYGDTLLVGLETGGRLFGKELDERPRAVTQIALSPIRYEDKPLPQAGEGG